ncbi:MAG: T9SS type A sorting domain-containing protein [Prevotella sp.]|nr:T9SS type A sorting domain-containing protein [Prevotella sp.]
MKNLILLATVLLCNVNLFAEEYDYFTFTRADGSEVTLPAIGLKITFNNGMITAINGQETQTVSLANINSMYFSNVAGIRKILSSDNAINVSNHQLFVTSKKGADITVTNMLGMVVCRCVSTSDNEQAVGGWLPEGVYIVKIDDQTLKVMVK